VSRRILITILVAYVLLATTYGLATPAWEAPDEPAHYLYAQHLVLHSSLPPPGPPMPKPFYSGGFVTSSYEWFQPPLYYALLAPQLALVDRLKPRSLPQGFPAVNPEFPAEVNLFEASPAPSLRERLSPPALRAARLFSVLLGLGTLLAIYRLALLVAPGDQVVALTATGLAAFIPQFTFMGGYVTNDNLANLMSAICLLACLTLLRGDKAPAPGRALALGLVVSLALWTKLSLLYTLLLGLLCLLWRLGQHRSLKTWLLETGLFVAAALGPLLLGLLFLPGLEERLLHYQTTLRVNPYHASLRFFVQRVVPLTDATFWGRFGWVNVAIPEWIVLGLDLIALIGLAGSLRLFVRGGQEVRLSLALLWLTCGLVLFGFVRFNLAELQPQGRLLFPALPALATLVSIGLAALAGRRRRLVGAGLVVLMFGLNLVSLFGFLLPAYA
jgi:4-amino-4-deoxy-L-arabinose transferase-like glycosyltransferase